MPRYMSNDPEYLYRVVVKTTWPATDERKEGSWTQNYGSYNTLASAKTQAARHRVDAPWGRYDRIIEAVVQRTKVEWEDVN